MINVLEELAPVPSVQPPRILPTGLEECLRLLHDLVQQRTGVSAMNMPYNTSSRNARQAKMIFCFIAGHIHPQNISDVTYFLTQSIARKKNVREYYNAGRNNYKQTPEFQTICNGIEAELKDKLGQQKNRYAKSPALTQILKEPRGIKLKPIKIMPPMGEPISIFSTVARHEVVSSENRVAAQTAQVNAENLHNFPSSLAVVLEAMALQPAFSEPIQNPLRHPKLGPLNITPAAKTLLCGLAQLIQNEIGIPTTPSRAASALKMDMEQLRLGTIEIVNYLQNDQSAMYGVIDADDARAKWDAFCTAMQAGGQYFDDRVAGTTGQPKALEYLVNNTILHLMSTTTKLLNTVIDSRYARSMEQSGHKSSSVLKLTPESTMLLKGLASKQK